MNVQLDKKTIGLVLGAKAAFVAVGLIIAAVPAFAQSENVRPDMTTMNISAQVDVKTTPDQAQISAGVMNIGKTAQQALQENAGKMTTVFAALKAAGIPEKDIQTTGVNISAQYVYEENKSPRITGYQATNNVNVVLKDLKNIGKVLDTLVAQGANQLNGPTFSVEDPDKILDEARKEAVAKAQKRAELYASAAGIKVKRILTISESTSNNQPMPYPMMAKRMMAADSAGASSPVASGEVGLSVTVNITYELGE